MASPRARTKTGTVHPGPRRLSGDDAVTTTKLIEIQCGTCGVWHAIPQQMYDTLKAEGGFWHCPNGHQRGWPTGSIRAERDRLKQRVAQLEDEAKEERAARIAADMMRAEAEKKLVASKRRALAGVCPCCSRTFQNVQRHMKTKHPNVVPIEQQVAERMTGR